MMFTFPKFTLDIDVEKTKSYYKNTAKNVSEDCTCSACRNYEQAIRFLPVEVTLFFTQLGVDMKKFREVYVNYTNADDTIHYGGFTHVCGRVIRGEHPWVSISENSKQGDEGKDYFLADGFYISYNEECHLLDDKFPFPAIQLEMSADLPWVLEETDNVTR